METQTAKVGQRTRHRNQRPPPTTSKWNKIEHRLVSPRVTARGWRAKPLVSYRVIVDLISATTTQTGLTVPCELDTSTYPKGIVVTDQEMSQINMLRDDCHGEWNYMLQPYNKQNRVVNS
jgi:hypothetical protein